MDATSQGDIASLFWVILVSLAVVIVVIVRLVRSGRAVPLPSIRMRPPRRADRGT
jgi:hypothetical protein